MAVNDSAIAARPETTEPSGNGLAWGLLGVAAFSFTVPLTRVAVEGAAMSPLFVGAGRAVIAAVLAALALGLTRQRLPVGAQWLRIAVVAAGVVVGFPLLTSYALTTTPASHGAVVIALLPAATAITAVLRTRERPPAVFWISSVVGMAVAIAFAAIQGGGLNELHRGDLLLFGAVVAAAVGYAEGGLLAKEIGAWQTVSWALLVAAPVMLAATVVAVVQQTPSGDGVQWLAFVYLSLVSMYLGFFAWYRGLAIGPMAQVSQIQLTQPVMSICWAALLLHEQLTLTTVVGGLAVIACAAAAVRVRTSAQRRPA